MANESENWTAELHVNMLDHFNQSERRTYEQRYWVNKDFDAEDTPVFLYICGEWTCRPSSVETNHFKIGSQLKALLLVLEHRYYGDSQPFRDADGGWSE